MNILSIDFDIIMSKDLNLYNNLVGPERPLDAIQKEFPVLNNVKANLNNYQAIFTIINNIALGLHPDDIKVALSHEDIKYLLEGQSNVNVFNIDNHHDIGYRTNNPEVCGCGNWAGYYLKNNTISHYTWIKNPYSEVDLNCNNERIIISNLLDFDFSTLPKIDKLFICFSPEWVNMDYHPLFFTILDTLNAYKNCHLPISY